MTGPEWNYWRMRFESPDKCCAFDWPFNHLGDRRPCRNQLVGTHEGKPACQAHMPRETPIHMGYDDAETP